MARFEDKMDALSFSNGVLRYEYRSKIMWSFPLTELRLIGEWTTDHGPQCEDYFLGFIAGRIPLWYEAPVGANPRIIEQLEMGQPVRVGLAASTTFKSRMIWPLVLQGQDLFEYTPQKRGRGLFNRFKDEILPLIHSALTQEVQEYLAQNPANYALKPTAQKARRG